MAQLVAIPALGPADVDGIESFYREYGFALLRGLYDEDLLATLDRECADAQGRLARRDFPDLWHSAARATDDGDAGIRRHIRGGWYGGEHLDKGHGLDDFVKNAAQ